MFAKRRGFVYVAAAAALTLTLGGALLWTLLIPTPVQAVVVPVESVQLAASQDQPAQSPLAPSATATAALRGPAGGPPLARSAGASRADLAELARSQPAELMRIAHERFRTGVRDYSAVLLKQERLGDTLSPVQEVEIRVREKPLAVYMSWRSNADQVKRAVFEDSPAYRDSDGNKVARVEPAGAIARMFVKDIQMPIYGSHAQKASRRSIDQCGFGALFELYHQVNELARGRRELDLRYSGEGRVDGRPTWILIRHLPYTGEGGPYPDARLVMHIDQEWLIPVALYSYADVGEKTLLGSYVFTKIQLNPGFGPDAFQF